MRILLFILIFTHALQGQSSYDTLEQKMLIKLDSFRVGHKIPGMSVSIRFNDTDEINMASGFASLEEHSKLTPGDRMLSGSTGKMFFSAAILKLIEDGRLSLDDLASTYLNSYTWFSDFPNHESITIRHLMNHTSGLPRHVFQESFLSVIKENPSIPQKPIDAIQSISGMDAIHPAGESWAYSDTNYILLGLIYEAVSGVEMYEAVKQDIILPAGLDNTIASVQCSIPRLVQGYIGDLNPFGLGKHALNESGTLYVNPAFEWTGGGYATNARDLAGLLKYIHESGYLSEESLENLRDAVDMQTGKPSDEGYGLGTFVWRNESGYSYGHLGFFPGYVSYASYNLKGQYAIAIQINHDGFSSKLSEVATIIEDMLSEYADRIDRNLIYENFEKQENCWNASDIECYMDAYAKRDLIQTISRAGVTYGYGNILNNYKRYFPKDRMGELNFDQVAMQRLSRTLYFVTGRFNLDMPDREELVQGYFSTVCRKINGRWYMVTDHSS